jgi:HEPN domain-containing protein
MLKALIAKQTKELPPRSHNLVLLAERALLKMSAEDGRFLRELAGYYVQSRYPEEIREISKEITPEMAREILGKTEEMYKPKKVSRYP